MLMPRLHTDENGLVGFEPESGSIMWFAIDTWWQVYCGITLENQFAEAAIAMVKWFYAHNYTLDIVLADPDKLAAYHAAEWTPIIV